MDLLKKNIYKINNTKNYFKKNSFLFFFSGLNKNSKNNLSEKKKLKSFKLHYYKINNKITIRLLKDSVKYFISFLINGSLFLIKFNNNNNNNKILIKSVLIIKFYLLFPIILALKLNNKIYCFILIKNVSSLSYFQNKQLISQFCILKLKNYNSFLNDFIKK